MSVRIPVIMFFLFGLLVTRAEVSSSVAAGPTNSSDRTVTSKIETAYQSGEISLDTALLYTVYAVKDPGMLPAKFRSEKPMRCGTLHLLEAVRNLDRVDPKTRGELTAYLSRPTLSGPEITITSSHCKIHYTTSGEDAVTESYAQSISDYAETSWNTEVTTLGWEAPPPDNIDGNEYDMYIMDSGGENWVGYTQAESIGPDPNQEDYTSYIVIADDLDADLAKVTVAHEFNHACQYSYSVSEANFWYENCATWMEDMVYDRVNDYYNYVTSSWENPLYWPEFSITRANGEYEYGACVFVFYLTERHADNSLPRRVWALNATHSGDHTIADIDSILSNHYGSSFEEALKEYSVWRYFTGTRSDGQHFSEGSSWTTSYVSASHIHDSYPAQGNQGEKAPSGYGTSFMRFDSPGEQDDLTITFDGKDGYSWAAMIAFIPGTQTAEMDLGTGGSGSLEVNMGTYTSAVLIPVVASSSGSNLSYAYSASQGGDQAAPTMEPIAESQSQWYRQAPVLSNFGFDDNINLDDGWYQINSCAGTWSSLFTDVSGQAWDANGWTMPGFDGLSQGNQTVYFKVDDDAGNVGGGCDWSWVFKKDTVSPSDPAQVGSISHQVGTWSQDQTIEVVWSASVDPAPGSGLDGYSILWNTSPAVSPDAAADIENGTLSMVSLPQPDGHSYYFHIRSVDALGNASGTVHLGPFRIDLTAPVGGTIVINNDDDTTNSSAVELGGLGSSDAGSGMGTGAQMRFSNDGVSWSPPESYASVRQGWDVTEESYGGTPYDGIKTVYVRYRDVIGNWSSPFTDEIVYRPALMLLDDPLSIGYVGFAYGETLVAVGAVPPWEWMVTSGVLPQGLALDPVAGIISGIPLAAETAVFRIEIIDAGQNTSAADFALTVREGSKGDANADGAINILDALFAVNGLLGIESLNEYEVWSADCNGDGALNIVDILGIVNVTLGIGSCSS